MLVVVLTGNSEQDVVHLLELGRVPPVFRDVVGRAGMREHVLLQPGHHHPRPQVDDLVVGDGEKVRESPVQVVVELVVADPFIQLHIV